jgi:hypothetical protein
MQKTWLSDVLLKIQEVFEYASPSILSMLAVFLPYLTPLPIAAITASSAKEFLGMSATVAFIFVFVLEGIGLWTTVIFVDSIVQFIRSRNAKTTVMVIALFIVICVYITILINLNVSLEEASKNVSPVYSRVITLICFLPLISGFMSGYYKIQIDHKHETEKEKAERRELEERRHQEAREDKFKNKMLKRGINPLTQNELTVSSPRQSAPQPVRTTSTDWRVVVKTLTPEQIDEIANQPAPVTEALWKLSDRTARNWKKAAIKHIS